MREAITPPDNGLIVNSAQIQKPVKTEKISPLMFNQHGLDIPAKPG